ncbi:MAG: MmgE/PrpD family protein [Chloroflexi bacterium]|nr:MmgE/PrpD family protein [Chloroflexota bacterium]
MRETRVSYRQSTSRDIVSSLVSNIVAIDYDALPDDVVQMTKKQILDALGCIVAGSSGLRMNELVNLVEAWGGKGESTVVNYGRRVSSPNAALANATMGSIWDFDDTLDEQPIHAEVPVVSAAFAVGESKGVVSGKGFIAAVALGIDLAYRMVLANKLHVGSGFGWDYSVTYGYFSAAATSGKILGLDAEKLRNALAIAYQQAGGAGMGGMPTKDGASDEPLGSYSTKELGRGFAANGGVMAAFMAEKGFTGMRDFLTDLSGLYNAYMRGQFVPEPLTEDLGKAFRGIRGGFKPYSSCRCNHVGIDAALALVKENDIRAEAVKRITAYVNKHIEMSNCEPLKIKHSPPDPGSAMFSLPWVVALAIMYRRVDPRGFTFEALKNRDLLDLAHKVNYQYKPELETGDACQPGILEIEINSGHTYSKRIDHLFGSTENPMSLDDIITKFRDCATMYAAKPISAQKAERVVQMVMQLQDLADAGQIIRLLA